MQVTTLKTAGDNPLAQTVRREVAYLISQLEIADAGGTPSPEFAAFLAHAAAVTPGYAGPVLPATQAIVTDAGTVNVENSVGSLDSPATAVVAASVLTSVKLAATKTIVTNGETISVTDSSVAPSVPAVVTVGSGVASVLTLTNATDCILQNGTTVVVQNSAGTGVPGAHTATVAAGGVSKVNLSLTVGIVANGVKQSGWTVTGSGTFFTPTVTNGVCTGGVLSAS